MNRRLSEERIRVTCRELLAKHESVSGRRLRAELRQRFGAIGKTERVFAIWRDEMRAAAEATGPTAMRGTITTPVAAPAALPATGMPMEIAELQRRLAAAEGAAAENLARAERAEYREQAHQDKWAMEIDRLRQALKEVRAGGGR